MDTPLKRTIHSIKLCTNKLTNENNNKKKNEITNCTKNKHTVLNNSVTKISNQSTHALHVTCKQKGKKRKVAPATIKTIKRRRTRTNTSKTKKSTVINACNFYDYSFKKTPVCVHLNNDLSQYLASAKYVEHNNVRYETIFGVDMSKDSPCICELSLAHKQITYWVLPNTTKDNITIEVQSR
jgi:hypothetical protein